MFFGAPAPAAQPQTATVRLASASPLQLRGSRFASDEAVRVTVQLGQKRSVVRALAHPEERSEARRRLDPYHGSGQAPLRAWPNKVAVVSQLQPLMPPKLFIQAYEAGKISKEYYEASDYQHDWDSGTEAIRRPWKSRSQPVTSPPGMGRPIA